MSTEPTGKPSSLSGNLLAGAATLVILWSASLVLGYPWLAAPFDFIERAASALFSDAR